MNLVFVWPWLKFIAIASFCVFHEKSFPSFSSAEAQAIFSAVSAILLLSASSIPHLTSNLSSKHMFSLVCAS